MGIDPCSSFDSHPAFLGDFDETRRDDDSGSVIHVPPSTIKTVCRASGSHPEESSTPAFDWTMEGHDDSSKEDQSSSAIPAGSEHADGEEMTSARNCDDCSRTVDMEHPDGDAVAPNASNHELIEEEGTKMSKSVADDPDVSAVEGQTLDLDALMDQASYNAEFQNGVHTSIPDSADLTFPDTDRRPDTNQTATAVDLDNDYVMTHAVNTMEHPNDEAVDPSAVNEEMIEESTKMSKAIADESEMTASTEAKTIDLDALMDQVSHDAEHQNGVHVTNTDGVDPAITETDSRPDTDPTGTAVDVDEDYVMKDNVVDVAQDGDAKTNDPLLQTPVETTNVEQSLLGGEESDVIQHLDSEAQEREVVCSALDSFADVLGESAAGGIVVSVEETKDQVGSGSEIDAIESQEVVTTGVVEAETPTTITASPSRLVESSIVADDDRIGERNQDILPFVGDANKTDGILEDVVSDAFIKKGTTPEDQAGKVFPKNPATIHVECDAQAEGGTSDEASSVDLVDSFQQTAFDAEAELDSLFGEKTSSSPAPDNKTKRQRSMSKASVSTVAPKGPVTKKKSKSRSTVPHRTPPIRQWTIPPPQYPPLPAITKSTTSAPLHTRGRHANKHFQPTVPVPFRLRTEERFQSRNCPCCAYKKQHASPTSVVDTAQTLPASIEPTQLTKKY